MLKFALLGKFLPLVCIAVAKCNICDCLRNEVAEKYKTTTGSYFCVVLNKSAKPPRVLFKTRLINVLNKTLQKHSNRHFGGDNRTIFPAQVKATRKTSRPFYFTSREHNTVIIQSRPQNCIIIIIIIIMYLLPPTEPRDLLS
jgi:hypothetical protein